MRTPQGIGLTRGSVELVEHDPAWFAAAAGICREVRNLGGDALADVQHVGSTSVPGLISKPVLDIVAGFVSGADVKELERRLTSAGYRYAIMATRAGACSSWSGRPACVPSAFTLSSTRGLSGATIASEYAGDRASYTSAKAAFIRGVLDRWP